MNKHQNYLLEMKMALIQALDWEDCFSILAYNNYKLFKENYPNIRRFYLMMHKNGGIIIPELMKIFIIVVQLRLLYIF